MEGNSDDESHSSEEQVIKSESPVIDTNIPNIPSIPDIPEQKKLNEISDEVSISGVAYDDYKNSYKGKGNFTQCSFCAKFFHQKTNGFITQNDEGEPICYHCLFWVNYSMELRSQVDGVFGKTIHDYILECYPFHNTETCSRRGECFVCDYLDGIVIEGIFGSEELYSKWKSERNPIDTDDMKIVINI